MARASAGSMMSRVASGSCLVLGDPMHVHDTAHWAGLPVMDSLIWWGSDRSSQVTRGRWPLNVKALMIVYLLFLAARAGRCLSAVRWSRMKSLSSAVRARCQCQLCCVRVSGRSAA